MSQTVIRVEQLGKKYLLAQQAGRYTNLREKITQKTKFLTQKILTPKRTHKFKPTREEFWALKDVSFEVKQGECIGIIGGNGAGKSTLLKVLSRITEPTKGKIRIKGRVASLLEVGTGFHPELTGRENIYLNGAILGMSKVEIKSKFDEIVAFAEVEKFLDTPVKRYSSGMYVRLAFAVAAHLEPEILIIDEVLAVGDIAFQKKCLGKMENVATQEGRTVLFVSHNMQMVQALCAKACLLKAGSIAAQGDSGEVIEQYLLSLRSLTQLNSTILEQRQDRSGDGSAKLTFINIEDGDGSKIICSISRLKLTIGYRSEKPIYSPRFLVTIYDYNNEYAIFSLDSNVVGGVPELLPAEGTVTCITEPMYLTPGRCRIELELLRGEILLDCIEYATCFDVEAYDIYGSGKSPPRSWATCLLQYQWSTNVG